jgi:DNA-binding transcriptional MerR regulator
MSRYVLQQAFDMVTKRRLPAVDRLDSSEDQLEGNKDLPAIPAKRYFTIGEVSDLCGVKPHVLRYWEQEFPQLKPVKRRGNRRYYQRQDVITIRQIRSLLYDEGFTIGGARNRLEGDEAREDNTQSRQVIRQVRAELEELLRILRR